MHMCVGKMRAQSKVFSLLLVLPVFCAAESRGNGPEYKACQDCFLKARRSANYEKAANCYKDFIDATRTMMMEQEKLQRNLGGIPHAAGCTIDAQQDMIVRACVERAESLLAQGLYKEGFKLFDWRLYVKNDREAERRADKLVNCWDGSDPRGKIILVRAEMGFGDTFFCLRFVKALKELGAYVMVFTSGSQNLLKTFLRTSCPYIDLVRDETEEVPQFDYDVYMMSLPRYISQDHVSGKIMLAPTEVDTIPLYPRYIFANEERLAFWQPELKKSADFKIGICWRASAQAAGQTRYLKRDVPLRLLSVLGSLPNVKLYNLLSGFNTPMRKEAFNKELNSGAHLTGKNEKGEYIASKLKNLAFDVIPDGAAPIYSFLPLFDKAGAFVDTTAVMDQMDLIISVDTAAANLAGGMGKRVWILLPYVADWRWLTPDTLQKRFGHSDVSPWIPTARLFWQPNEGDWESVAQQVESALKELLNAQH